MLSAIAANIPGMFKRPKRSSRRNSTDKETDQVTEELRHAIAANLDIESDRIQYGSLGRQGKFGTTDPHWLIHYRGEWRELPWHFDGPLLVTRAMVRAWYGQS